MHFLSLSSLQTKFSHKVVTVNQLFSNRIAVIDSGVGGLTILGQLRRKYPFCNFVYLADNAFCPYGTKHPDEIVRRVQTIVDYLQDSGVCAVVLACNTASVYADIVRTSHSIPIYDVIVPTCKLVASTTYTKRIALLATNATVNSGAYNNLLHTMGVAVVSFPCSSFVPFVEQNAVDSSECEKAVRQTLKDLPRCQVDTVILGCTHFPVLKNKIAPYANGAKIIECCTDFLPSFCGGQSPSKTLFLTTGVPKHVDLAAQWCENARFFHVDV